MKVLTEEEQVQQGAFLWRATPTDSQVELGLSRGLWILMMVHWSRYANIQCRFSPVSAENNGCVQTCNLCCMSFPSVFIYVFIFGPYDTPTSLLPLSVCNFWLFLAHALPSIYFLSHFILFVCKLLWSHLTFYTSLSNHMSVVSLSMLLMLSKTGRTLNMMNIFFLDLL